MRKTSRLIFSFLILSALMCTAASAHEFIVKPHANGAVTPGQEVPMSVVSAHVFMISEELEGEGDAANIDLRLVDAAGEQPLALKKNKARLTWDTVAKVRKNGTAVVAAHRKPMYWTHTTKGWKQASKKGLSGVIKSSKYEKFSKTLLTVGGKTAGFDRVLGQRLEIVPVDDPASVRPGQELTLKVLLDGKPLATPILATFDGFSKQRNTYAYYTEDCCDDGTAKVRITSSGLWMVRVEHKVHEPNELYDDHVMRSVLVFEVI